MKLGLANRVKAVTLNTRRKRFQLEKEAAVPNLDVAVERALEGARRCRQCAGVYGKYSCTPSRAVQNEWRHSEDGLELIVHLLTCRPDSRPYLQAMIRVEDGGQLHARAIYSCELPDSTLRGGPWSLSLICEQSECDFVFPGQVEVTLSGEPRSPTR